MTDLQPKVPCRSARSQDSVTDHDQWYHDDTWLSQHHYASGSSLHSQHWQTPFHLVADGMNFVSISLFELSQRFLERQPNQLQWRVSQQSGTQDQSCNTIPFTASEFMQADHCSKSISKHTSGHSLCSCLE